MKRGSFFILAGIVFLVALVSTILISCNEEQIIECCDELEFLSTEYKDNTPGEDMYADVDNELPPESFVGTVLSEDTTHMVVRPNPDEDEYFISDNIRVEYLHDHLDYLYGIGRKVVITYIPPIAGGKTITTDDIRHDGFEDFELSVQYVDDTLPVYASRPYYGKNLVCVLNNKSLNVNASDYNLFYQGLSDVYVTVDGTTLALREALEYGKVTLDGIIAECNRLSSIGAIQSETYKDGGSVMYDFGDYKIIKYHTLDGNRDVYIGTSDMDINAVNLGHFFVGIYEWKDWGLRLEAKNVSRDGATIVFEQNGGNVTGSLQTGEEFWLERRAGNKWLSVDTNPLIDYAFYMVAYGIKHGDKTELKTEWQWLYDNLEDGHYRIIKPVMDFRETADYDKQIFYAYFEISGEAEEK